MNDDDYLWDRSGEPDPEVERLERVLGKYRYQAKPLSPTLNARLSERRGGWITLAAVAAALLIVLAGFWIFKVQNKSVTAPLQSASGESQPQKQDKNEELAPMVKELEQVRSIAVAHRSPRRIHRKSSPEMIARDLPNGDSEPVAERQPMMNPFIDVETARHIERAQLLLRSFRNTRDSGAKPDPDLSYEKQRSRGLLSKNILLRRDAEAKGNMPAEELLGSLEPFLLDIANLPDRPSNDDVRSIKERMQKKEIVSALQVYSAPTLSQVF
jgi:hypothetical protein